MNYANQFICGSDGDALEISNLSTTSHPEQWFLDWARGGQANDAGVTVNGYTALTYAPVWQAVNIIAGDLGQVPIRLVKDEFFEQRKHYAWNLLQVRPNDLQTPSLFIETLMQWALIWGNGVAWIQRRGSVPASLIPLRPDCLWPELIEIDGVVTLIYHYISPALGHEYIFRPDEVIHIQGLTGDGIWGYPLWQIAKNCIGGGLAAEKHGNKQFSNGARPSGVLEHPMKLSEQARAALREDWERIHGGTDNAGRIAILWEGMKFNPISQTNSDAQWNEAKKLNVIDAARLFNIPAFKLNALEDSSSRANLEEQNESYKQMSLTRWSTRIDQEFRRKLLTRDEWMSDRYRFAFDWDYFLRADIDTNTQVADRCVKGEIMNRNEARRMIGLPPYEGGERFGSPAINKTPEDGAESPENGRPRGSKTTNQAHQELLLDRILHFLQREAISVKQAATNATNFVKWLDEFYVVDEAKISALCDSVMGTSINACCAVGLDARGMAIAVANYAKTRHAQLLEACSGVTRTELPAMVEKFSSYDQTLVAQGLLETALGGLLEHEKER